MSRNIALYDRLNAALTQYVQRRKQRRIPALFGKIDYDPDYDYKTERRRNHKRWWPQNLSA